MKILLVDDDLIRSKRIKNFLLQSFDFIEEVVVSNCTSSAQMLLKNNFYDILILDVVLPRREFERAHASQGLNLLDLVFSSSKIRKPEKIIGITSHLQDINSFKERFAEKCLIVIEVTEGNGDWKNKINRAIDHSYASRFSRENRKEDVVVITVHGIRTFGEWQSRLKKIVFEKYGNIEFHNYRYGFFSVFSFCIPFLRNREVKYFARKFQEISSQGKKVYVFSHSFGTYLSVMAVKELADNDTVINIRKMVLAGSVLKRNFDWGFLNKFEGCQVINDCGTRDSVLLFSESLVLGTGMAGRSGFKGFENDLVVNRFFEGGHSFYFDGDAFMSRYWANLLSNDPIIDSSQNYSFIRHELVEQLAKFFGMFKWHNICFNIFICS